MAKVTITVKDEARENQIGISIEFDPECEGGNETPAQVAALLMVKMATERLDGRDVEI